MYHLEGNVHATYHKHIETQKQTTKNIEKGKKKKRFAEISHVMTLRNKRKGQINTNRIIFKEHQGSACEDKPPLLP